MEELEIHIQYTFHERKTKKKKAKQYLKTTKLHHP